MSDKIYGIVGGGKKTKKERLLVADGCLGVVLTIVHDVPNVPGAENALAIIVDKEALLKTLKNSEGSNNV